MTPSSSKLRYPTNSCEYHLRWLERIRRGTCCCWAICSLRGRYRGWLLAASSSLTWCETSPVWISSLRNSWRQSSRHRIPSQRSSTNVLSYSSMQNALFGRPAEEGLTPSFLHLSLKFWCVEIRLVRLRIGSGCWSFSIGYSWLLLLPCLQCWEFDVLI